MIAGCLEKSTESILTFEERRRVPVAYAYSLEFPFLVYRYWMSDLVLRKIFKMRQFEEMGTAILFAFLFFQEKRVLHLFHPDF